jgi:myosin heavy subunit
MKTLLFTLIFSIIVFVGMKFLYDKKSEELKQIYIEKEESILTKYNLKNRILTDSKAKYESTRNDYEQKVALLKSKEQELEDWQRTLDDKQSEKDVVSDELEQLKQELTDSSQLLRSLEQSIANEQARLSIFRKKLSGAKRRYNRYNAKKANELIVKFYNLYYVNNMKIAQACKSDSLNRKLNVSECKLAKREEESARYILDAIRLYAKNIKRPNRYERFLRKHTKTLELIR